MVKFDIWARSIARRRRLNECSESWPAATRSFISAMKRARRGMGFTVRSVHLGPMLASTVDPPVAQQKRQQLLALAAKILRCGRARSDKITDRFVHHVGHPNRRQITGAQQPSQCHGIAPVGLDPLARALWRQRGRDDDAVVTQSTDLAK